MSPADRGSRSFVFCSVCSFICSFVLCSVFRHEASRLLAAFSFSFFSFCGCQARELMKYLINHKDLSRWCKEKSLELDVGEPVHDLAGAEALIERYID